MIRRSFGSKSYFISLLCVGIVMACAGCVSVARVLGIDLKIPDSSNLVAASAPLAGSEFYREVQPKSFEAREEATLEAILDRNIPEHVAVLRPVYASMAMKSGTKVKAVYYVTSDYLAVGNNSDFVHVPMTPMSAQKIADEFGFLLPTRKMVNDIYRQAKIKLSPSPLPPSNKMTTVSYFSRHAKLVSRQLRRKPFRSGIVAGHKKDIVITNRLVRRPFQVAIYGWHQRNGRAIQPLSLVHTNTYADYSHGVRLVRQYMLLNGQKVRVQDVLKHRELSQLLSDEGPIANPRVKTTTNHRWLASVIK